MPLQVPRGPPCSQGQPDLTSPDPLHTDAVQYGGHWPHVAREHLNCGQPEMSCVAYVEHMPGLEQQQQQRIYDISTIFPLITCQNDNTAMWLLMMFWLKTDCYATAVLEDYNGAEKFLSPSDVVGVTL